MKSFAAQQLTKKQMNEVKGGDINCTLRYMDDDGNMIKEEGTVGGANNAADAARLSGDKYATLGFKLVSVYC